MIVVGQSHSSSGFLFIELLLCNFIMIFALHVLVYFEENSVYSLRGKEKQA